MRLSFYRTQDGNLTLWKNITTVHVADAPNELPITQRQAGGLTISTFEGYWVGEVIYAPLTENQVLLSSTENYNNANRFGRSGHLSFVVNTYNTSFPHSVGLKSVKYDNVSLVSDMIQSGSNAQFIRTFDYIYNGIEFVVFAIFIDLDWWMVRGISRNAFEGSFVPRFPPPTEPDDDGGYGTGSTPSGNQDGTVVNVDVGGDTVNVAPPNVTVDVEVNMPEINAPQINHPDGINIALVSNAALKYLNDALWGRSSDGFDNLWLQFQNYSYDPMKAIISCIKLPRWVVKKLESTAGAESDIGVAGTTIPLFRGRKINPAATVRETFVIASLSQFNSYQDFVGVTIRAYAPFVGWFELDPSLCCGISTNTGKCTIEFEYTIDVTNGNVGVVIWAYTVGKSDTQAHRTPIACGSGNCAYPVLLSANDRGISDVVGGFTQIIGGLATMTGGAVTGNVPLAIAGGVGMTSGSIQGTLAQQHTTTVGGVSGSVGYLNYLIPFVMVIKPRFVEPKEYTKIYGRPSYAKAKVSDFEGHWAQLDVHCENFGFANEREQKLIIDALAKGVYV